MPNKRLFFLFELYLSNQANDQEKGELMCLLTDPVNEELARELLRGVWEEFEPKNQVFTALESKRMLSKILETDENNGLVELNPVKINWLNTWRWHRIIEAAAVLLILFSIELLFVKKPVKENQLISSSIIKSKGIFTPNIPPGGNKAILTLANGTKIALNDISNGKIANESGISISKASDGQLVYTIRNQKVARGSKKNLAPEFNTITTPRGGQYQIDLPDGSKVWLNSESSLKFPTLFLNSERKVELTGEAYFEISSLERDHVKMPFKVVSRIGNGRSQEVEVLGTHFNIHAYENENRIKTTLLEGSVKVANLNSKTINILHPGQQSILNENKTDITEVDIEEVMAWKNGNFVFNNTKLNDILKQLERWYDIEVDYDRIPDTRYHGFISKHVTLSQVLEMLELTGNLKFKIENQPLSTRNRIEIVNK